MGRVVFVPERRYRITKTSYIWPSVRLIGFGAANQQPRRSGHGNLNLSVSGDTTPGTFYSAMSNIDLEIADGNAGAVAVRARYGQHCYLAHMEFRIGSGLAAIHDGGNEAEHVDFLGGATESSRGSHRSLPLRSASVIASFEEGQAEGSPKSR
jgi:hypothetical protein